jgi:hypothetical protein
MRNGCALKMVRIVQRMNSTPAPKDTKTSPNESQPDSNQHDPQAPEFECYTPILNGWEGTNEPLEVLLKRKLLQRDLLSKTEQTTTKASK